VYDDGAAVEIDRWFGDGSTPAAPRAAEPRPVPEEL
jgi:hypothetical protein